MLPCYFFKEKSKISFATLQLFPLAREAQKQLKKNHKQIGDDCKTQKK